MISKHKISFESLSDKRWKNLDKKLQIDVSKYRRVRRDVREAYPCFFGSLKIDIV